MLPHTSIHPLNPQFAKVPFFGLAIAVGVLHCLFDAADGGTECAVGTSTVSFGFFDDSFVFLGGHGSFASDGGALEGVCVG